jgi:hypothetical protein
MSLCILLLKLKLKIELLAYNPSYSGARDQEDRSLKPAGANILPDPILKKRFTKIGLVEWLKVKALSSNAGTGKKKRNKTTTIKN